MAKITSTASLTATEVTINAVAKTITLNIAGNLSTDGVNLDTLYSYLKQQWKNSAEYIKYPFPMVAITVESFEMVSGWDWGNQATKDLIRDGGWALKAAGTGALQETYMNLTSLGNFDDPNTDLAYFLQVDGGTKTDVELTGPVNQAIKIYGDASHGNFDYTTFFKIYLREQGKTFAFYDLIVDQNLTVLENKKYALPLSNGTDLKVSAADAAIDVVSGSVVGVATQITFTAPDQINGTVTTSEFPGTFASQSRIFISGTENGTNDGYYTIASASATTLLVDEAIVTSTESGSVTVTEAGVADAAPYNNMTITYLTGSVFGAWANSATYAAGTVVKDSLINVNSSTLGTWWLTPGGGTTSGTGTGDDVGITDWVSYTGERQVGLEWYAYNKIIAGNQGTAEQIYEFSQFSLRQPIDIDRSDAVNVGNTAVELLNFIGDTLKTEPGVFIDNFQSADTNRLEFVDVSSTTRTFPFVAAGTLQFNDNLVGDGASIYRVFFTSVPSGSYGTTDAVTIQDAAGPADIASTVSAQSSISFDFDYDNNAQGGRTAGTDAAYTAVAVGLTGAQFVVTTGSIVKSTTNAINFVAALERNYNA